MRLIAALWMIRARTGGLSLEFLGDWPVEQAHAWLEMLPGVGPKVAACILNFSTLRRRSMVIDTHVLRVARRYGLAAPNVAIGQAWETLMDAAPVEWDADDLFDLHVHMKVLGQQLCTHEHTYCGRCPLAVGCVGAFK